MSNKELTEQIRAFYEPIDENEDLWKSLRIDFRGEAAEFPDNKIYATINIEPESARRLISKFSLFVNTHKRGEFDSSYQYISAAGFDVIKQQNHIDIKIEAIPLNENWNTIRKESESCRFSFTRQILTLSPVIRFDYIDEYSTFNVLIKWYHIGDHYAQKYVVCLDEKEVHYIDQLPVNKEIQICIHRMKPDKSHTVQIIAKLKNGKETNRSDLINFKVPCQEDQETYEVITVINEPVPLHLLGFIVRHDDTKEKQSTSKYDRFKQRALELHRRLRLQIEKSGKY